MAAVGHLAFDEQGRPFFILRDQEKQRQLTGIEALKVSYFLQTSSNHSFIQSFIHNRN